MVDITTPEQQLIKAREKFGWTTQQVAEALNLPSYAIILLEAGDFAKLHGSVYVISYIKAYAALFSLDGDELVDQYRKSIQQAKPSDEYVAGSIPTTTNLSASVAHKRYRTMYGVLAAIAMVAVVGILMASPLENSSQQQEVAVLDEAIVLDTAMGTTTIETVDILPNHNPTASMVVQPDMAGVKTSAEVMVNQRAEQKNQPLSMLNFEFSADCWVEVLDGDNKKIFSSMQRAQERLELEGKPPFHVTLGYAPGVSLSYNGELIEIDAKNAKYKKLVLGNS